MVSFQSAPTKVISDSENHSLALARSDRFALQSAVRRILPYSSTAKCLINRQAKINEVEIWHSFVKNSAHYIGLQTCGSVWNCPVCTEKISQTRKNNMRLAIGKHETNGGQVLLLTLTNRHSYSDNLQDLLTAQALAMSRFNSMNSAKTLRKNIGCLGTIRIYEVTHGKNGWHPHFHILLFVNSGLDLVELRSKFYKIWSDCCRLAKLPIPSKLHGVKLEDGSKSAKYVSKGMYGLDTYKDKDKDTDMNTELDKEITRKSGNRTPFDLLRSYLYKKDNQARALFVEYSIAFKGKRQVVWSRGLKKRFLIDEISDAEAANKIEEFDLLGKITFEEWQAVNHFNLRSQLLKLAKSGSWMSIRPLLDDLVNKQRMGY